MKDYTGTVSGNAKDGYVITNTHRPEEPPKEEPPVTPRTGDNTRTGAMAGLAAGSLLGAAVLFVLWKRRREEG